MVLGPLGDKFGARQTLGASLILSALSMVHICVVKALCVCVCVCFACIESWKHIYMYI